MSCCICLLPFVPAARSLNPRRPPPGILTPQQDSYFRLVCGIDSRIMGAINTFEYLDDNLFLSPEMHFIKWEGDVGTFSMMHAACANILRHFFGVENNCHVEDFARICEIEEVLGRPQCGENAGRIPFVPYETIGHPKDMVDVRHFWQCGGDPGMNTFAWQRFSESHAGWALAKPAVFPRFFSEPREDRFSLLGEPAAQPGIFTRMPIDVLLLFLPHLTPSSFVALSATCRLLRQYALTVFQPHARAIVLSLGWATPLLGLGEYEAAVSRNPKSASYLVHPIDSPRTGDWFLYLSHVHRTPSMRARRRIWNICEAVLCAVEERLPSCEYGRHLEAERTKMEIRITIMNQAMLGMRKMMEVSNSGTPFAPTSSWPPFSTGHVSFPNNQ